MSIVTSRDGQRGQAFALFAISLVVIILAVGLVIDGGNALVQRRASQNASDFGALAGARVVAESISGDNVNGIDANVQASIQNAVTANGGTITFGAPNGPYYVQTDGTSTGVYVGSGSIPSGAVGVTVRSTRAWSPYFLGIVGMTNWSASADATAKGGYAAGGPGGGVFPAGIAQAFFNGKVPCNGPVSTDPTSPCYPQQMTPGTLNVPGGFGWLKFGCGPTSFYGLGQDPSLGGCDPNKPFLQQEIGPPPNSYGCCSQVGEPGSGDRIGSLPGNKASADCSYYIDNKITIYVPVWDTAGGTGNNAWYHIVGFTGFQLTACNGGKDIEGVWRVPFFLGPTTTTPGFAGAALAVQLVR